MAIVIGSPGASARRNWFIDLFVPPFVFLVIAMLIAPLFLLLTARLSPSVILLQVVLSVALGLFLWRDSWREIFDMMRGAANWAKGADGEALTAAALQALSDDYIVFHDFHPAKGGVTADWNVDHIVIGPNGVFVIETKNYSRRVVESAQRSHLTRKNVKQTQGNAIELKRRLHAWSSGQLGDVFVMPLLAYAQEDAYVEKTREGSVHVVPLKWLHAEITTYSGRRSLNPDEAFRIANVMFHELPPYLMDAFRAEFDRFAVKSRRFKLDRAAARSLMPELMATNPPTTSQEHRRIEGPPYDPSDTPSACPNCGGRLFERKARHGDRAGKRFLGCENYHSKGCRFIHNLEA